MARKSKMPETPCGRKTVSATLLATDGTPVRVIMPDPSTIPTQDRADVLRDLYRTHVKSLDASGHWKGPCEARVPHAIADDVADAMDFMGSIVDTRMTFADCVWLYSEGYWAHGF